MSLSIGRIAPRKFKLVVMYIAFLTFALVGVNFAAPQFFGQVAYAAGPWTVNNSLYSDDVECVSSTFRCATIQAAVTTASPNDTINVAAGTYNLTSRIDVNKSVNILGDVTTPSNVIINAPVAGGTQHGQNSVFMITSSNVTIKGFRIQGALHTGVAQNAGIYVDDPRLVANPGLSNITISNNEVTNNGYGIFVHNIKNSTISNNKVYSNKSTATVGMEYDAGSGIVVYGRTQDINHTYNLTIDNNQVYSNETDGIRVDVESTVGATDFVNDLAIGITNNIVHNNGRTILGADKYIGIKSSGYSKGVTVTGNEIYGHAMRVVPSTTNQSTGIWIAASNGWEISNNNIRDNTNGIFFLASTAVAGSGSHTISNNNIHANVRGISIDDGGEAVANNKNSIYSNDSTVFSGIGFTPYGIYNRGIVALDATSNWWGSSDPDFGSIISGTAEYDPYYVNAGMTQTNIQVASALAVAKATAVGKIQDDYTVESWSTLTDALALPEVTNTEMLAKTTAINNAIAALVTNAAADGLAIEKAAANGKVEANYTPASWATFADVIVGERTNALLMSETTNTQIVAKTAALNAAIGHLVLKTPFTAIDVITGTTTVDQTLIAGTKTPAGATVGYQWKIADTADGDYTNIEGATNNTYILLPANVGKYLKVVAIATGDYSGTQTSAASTVVAPTAINTAAIPGVTAPVTGGVPVSTTIATLQYTGVVEWSAVVSNFAETTIYTAYITLTPTTGYTLADVGANFFTVTGATGGVTNASHSGIVTAIFPATIAMDKAALTGAITAEVGGNHAAPVWAKAAADYTTATYNPYHDAVVAAITTEANTSATQAAVDSATGLIASTKAALVFAGEADLATAEGIAAGKVQADYTVGTWTTLTNALTLPHSTQAEIVTKTTMINNAVGDLLPTMPEVSTTPITPPVTTTSFEPETYDNGPQVATDSSLGSQATLGAQTTNDQAIDTIADSLAVSTTSSGWKIFGLMWYWWFLIGGVVASAWWVIAAAIRRYR